MANTAFFLPTNIPTMVFGKITISLTGTTGKVYVFGFLKLLKGF